MVKEKRWKDAKEFYTKGIAVLTKRMGSEGSGTIQGELKIQEACFINRALCNLELQNYRSTTLDCSATLKISPKNLKAYYRSAQALLALNKIDQAHDAAMHGLLIDRDNGPLKNLMDKIALRGEKRNAEDEKRYVHLVNDSPS